MEQVSALYDQGVASNIVVQSTVGGTCSFVSPFAVAKVTTITGASIATTPLAVAGQFSFSTEPGTSYFITPVSAKLDNKPLALSGTDVGFPCRNASNPTFKCPAKCICGQPAKFKEVDLQSQDNITYSPKYGLKLHVFAPPASDQRSKRPAMVMIHGGGFKNGNKDDKAGIIGWSKQLAMRGFFCVSIDYRINQTLASVDPEESQLWAAYDAKSAVRWLRTNAGKYHIDVERIGAFGSSAGAMTVAFMSTLSGVGDNEDNAGVSSEIMVGVSLSGALECVGPNTAYCEVIPNITSSFPPFLDFHGCNDGTVPYGPCSATSKPQTCWGSGVDTNRALVKAGVDAYLFSFPGKGHVPWGDLASEPAAGAMVSFLAQHLDLAHAKCP